MAHTSPNSSQASILVILELKYPIRVYIGIIGYILGFYIGIMEKKMETTGIIGFLYGYNGVYIGVLYWDNGKENGNYYNIIGYSGCFANVAWVPRWPACMATRLISSYHARSSLRRRSSFLRDWKLSCSCTTNPSNPKSTIPFAGVAKRHVSSQTPGTSRNPPLRWKPRSHGSDRSCSR